MPSGHDLPSRELSRRPAPAWAGRAALLGLLASAVAASFVASCATGTQLSTGTGGSGATGPSSSSSSGTGASDAGDSGPQKGQLGAPCTTTEDCLEGECTFIGGTKYCSKPCPPDCPNGLHCSIIDGDPICVPDLDQLCKQCKNDGECGLPSDRCLKAPLGDLFCARDCSVDSLCPNGFTCVTLAAYTDAGAPDAGASDAGADGSAPLPGVPFKWCVPNGGSSCPCNDKRDGVVHDCFVKNAYGTCTGDETCNAMKGKFEGCDAKTPAQESCNNKDDNCDGTVDDGDPNALCSALGPKPPHGNWACTGGSCALGACDPGYAAFPPGMPQDGCTCAVDPGEPNGLCAAATYAGSVSESGAPLTITGTLSSASDVDVISFDTVDVNEAGTNSYHVAIAFTSPSPNNEFVMDVMRGDPCSDAPSGAGTNITAYDWCVNGNSGTSPPKGELTCGNAANVNHCNNYSSKYYVRIYRKSGATASCTPYALTISAGGGACDMNASCP